MVGTWHFMWNTLGQRSQHSRSPPLIQTAHQSSLGSSSFPPELPVPADALPTLASVPLSKFPLVSGAPAVLLLFSEDNEVVEVIVPVEGEEVATPEPFSPEQGVSDWGSVLMRSPKALRASWPADTTPNTGRGLFSGLLIWGKTHTKTLGCYNFLPVSMEPQKQCHRIHDSEQSLFRHLSYFPSCPYCSPIFLTISTFLLTFPIFWVIQYINEKGHIRVCPRQKLMDSVWNHHAQCWVGWLKMVSQQKCLYHAKATIYANSWPIRQCYQLSGIYIINICYNGHFSVLGKIINNQNFLCQQYHRI